jgi:hypothetical protein
VTAPEKATRKIGNHYPFGALGRLFTVITSTSHSQARTIQGHTNTGLRHFQEDFHVQLDGPLPTSRNQNPISKHAAADSLPQNPTGAGTHPPVQNTQRDQQNYPPGTRKIRRDADRIYYLDRDDKVILSVLTTATRHEARPNHGSPATGALIDHFDSTIQSNVSGQGGSYQTTKHSSTVSTSTEKAREDASFSSRYVSIPRELPQSAGNDSTNLSTCHEIPRRTSPPFNTPAVQSSRPIPPTGAVVESPWGFTKAGKARKRLEQACVSCREKKTKCEPMSSNSKCLSCEKNGSECYTDST